MCTTRLVARGSFDVFYEDGFGGPWDVAAGAVLVHEVRNSVAQNE